MWSSSPSPRSRWMWKSTTRNLQWLHSIAYRRRLKPYPGIGCILKWPKGSSLSNWWRVDFCRKRREIMSARNPCLDRSHLLLLGFRGKILVVSVVFGNALTKIQTTTVNLSHSGAVCRDKERRQTRIIPKSRKETLPSLMSTSMLTLSLSPFKTLLAGCLR